MNSTTFLIRFGISPDGFELNNFEPIKTDKGFLYYIEQSKKHIDCPYCNCKNVFIKLIINQYLPFFYIIDACVSFQIMLLEKVNATINRNKLKINKNI